MTYEVYSDGFFVMPEAACYYSPAKIPVAEQTRRAIAALEDAYARADNSFIVTDEGASPEYARLFMCGRMTRNIRMASTEWLRRGYIIHINN